MEANKLRTVFIRLNLQEVISDAAHTVSKLAASKHITLATELEDISVRGDRTTLTQLFAILLENAIKYSPAQSSISVSLSKSRSQVTVSIQDHGRGIAQEALPHIFDRFYRADTARCRDAHERASQGFGLGLSLAKLIADLPDGELIVSSTEGKGTQVSVILPS